MLPIFGVSPLIVLWNYTKFLVSFWAETDAWQWHLTVTLYFGEIVFWWLNDAVSVVSAIHSIFPNINAQGTWFHDFWCPSMSQTSTLWWCLRLRCHDPKSDLSGANKSLFWPNLLGAAKGKCYKSVVRHFNNLNNPVPNEWCWKSVNETYWNRGVPKLEIWRPKNCQISGEIILLSSSLFSGENLLLNSPPSGV